MTDSRPHIIFIITDQQRYDTIAALGYDHMDTPHLDRLVRDCLLYTSPSPRDKRQSRMPSSA